MDSLVARFDPGEAPHDLPQSQPERKPEPLGEIDNLPGAFPHPVEPRRAAYMHVHHGRERAPDCASNWARAPALARPSSYGIIRHMPKAVRMFREKIRTAEGIVVELTVQIARGD